jgi:hypothetical protein
MRIGVFCDVMLCHWVSGSRYFEGTVLPWNFWNHSPNSATPHLGRLEFSATPLWEPQTSQVVQAFILRLHCPGVWHRIQAICQQFILRLHCPGVWHRIQAICQQLILRLNCHVWWHLIQALFQRFILRLHCPGMWHHIQAICQQYLVLSIVRILLHIVKIVLWFCKPSLGDSYNRS